MRFSRRRRSASSMSQGKLVAASTITCAANIMHPRAGTNARLLIWVSTLTITDPAVSLQICPSVIC